MFFPDMPVVKKLACSPYIFFISPAVSRALLFFKNA